MILLKSNDKLRNALIAILLVISSIIVSLAVCEALLRTFYPQVTVSEYPQTFLIDGKLSFEPGYFRADPVLPFALKANYRHTVNPAWSSKSFLVSLDTQGYRNTPSDVQASPIVFVGDSVIFGYGVEEEETMPAQLSNLMHQKVYNLGMPGAGPESYMVMLDRYLNESLSPRSIIIGFYTGNDFSNIEEATWKELSNCKPPASKIYRADVPPGAPYYPVWVSTSFLKSSHLANFLVGFATARKPENDWEIVQLHKLTSERAIAELKLTNLSQQDLEFFINRALDYATELEETGNLTKNERELLEGYKVKMHEKDWRSAYPIATEISISIINRDYNPISKSKLINIAYLFSAYSGYYWRVIDENVSGYILNYDHLLNLMKDEPSFREFASNFSAIQIKIRARDTTVEDDINKINEQLKHKFGKTLIATPAGCDKLDIFLERIQTLATNRDSNLMIVVIPPEYELKNYRDNNISDFGLCDRASKYKIGCLNLVPMIIKHYEKNSSALYLDGSHFNKQGNMLAAQWIYEWSAFNDSDNRSKI